jgi:hypothetical protein
LNREGSEELMAKKQNTHFSVEDWVDFTTQQAPPEEVKAMKQHLTTGCAKCTKLEYLWSHVAEVASRDSGHEPPASAVHHVCNAFAILAEAEGSKRAPTVPRLVFDSLWQPALAGVRSAHSTLRQVHYQAGAINIEMRLEPEPRSERVYVAGQVSDAVRQGEGIAEMPVVVASRRGTLTSASTNRFGEFHLAFVPEEGLRISFGTNDKEISIPLEGTGIRLFSRG